MLSSLHLSHFLFILFLHLLNVGFVIFFYLRISHYIGRFAYLEFWFYTFIFHVLTLLILKKSQIWPSIIFYSVWILHTCFVVAYGATNQIFVIFIMIRPTIPATSVFLFNVRIAIFQFYTAIIANCAVSGSVIVYYCYHFYSSYMFFITDKKPTAAITTKKRYQINSNV